MELGADEARRVETKESGSFMADAASRLLFWVGTTIGILGVILALNAGLQNDYAAAAACLAASSMALGINGYFFIRR
jgi:hypothetical protein